MNNSYQTPNSSSGGEYKKTPFRRVREEDVSIDPRVKDNSFEAKVSAQFSLKYLSISREETKRENKYRQHLAL